MLGGTPELGVGMGVTTDGTGGGTNSSGGGGAGGAGISSGGFCACAAPKPAIAATKITDKRRMSVLRLPHPRLSTVEVPPRTGARDHILRRLTPPAPRRSGRSARHRVRADSRIAPCAAAAVR